MIDFIFQVDLSIIYIIHRRDFALVVDSSSSSTPPLGGRFYYTAAEANSAARQYCQREAAKSSGNTEVVHGEKDALYRGACVVKEPGAGNGRYKFEVIVRQLRAAGDSESVRRESRGSVMVGTGARNVGGDDAGEEGPRRRFSWGETCGGGGSRPGTREGRGVFAAAARRNGEEAVAPAAKNRLSLVGERRPGTGVLRAVEEEQDSSGTDECGSPVEKRRSFVARIWGSLRGKQ